MPVRVLVLTNMYPPHAFGGYELSCRDVVRRWRRAGHEVRVLTSDIRVPEALDEPEDPGVERRLRLYWRDHRILDPPPVGRFRRESANQRALRRVLDGFRPEVVSAWAMGAMSMGLLTTVGERGLPLVAVICDEWPVYGPEVDAWARVMRHHRTVATVVRGLTGLPCSLPPLDGASACFVSAALLAKVRSASPWAFPAAEIVPSGIAPEDFPPPTGGEQRPWEWRLLYVGRIDPRKGIDTAVRALPSLPDQATLAIHGTGDDAHRRQLVELAGRLGVADRVHFASTPRAALGRVYREADAVVFPSTWDEPFGLVPLEAMACGTPVVATRVGGAAEFLDDGVNCLAVPPKDPEAVALAVRRIAGDDALRAQLVAGGLATASRLTVDAVAERLLTVHEAAVDAAATTVGGRCPTAPPTGRGARA